MRYRRVVAIGSIGLALFVGWLVSIHPDKPADSGADKKISVVPEPPVRAVAASPVALDNPEVGGVVEPVTPSSKSDPGGGQATEPHVERLQLQARLLAHRAVQPLHARIGLGRIDEQDLRDFIQDDRHESTWSEATYQLANTVQWLDATVVREPVGGWRLGPVAVPPADGYRVFAWGAQGYYLGDYPPFQPEPNGIVDVGDLQPIPFTGLRIRCRNGRGARFGLVVERRPDQEWVEEDSLMSQVLAFMSPTMAGVYRGSTLELNRSVTTLAPMIPDPAVSLRLVSRSGARSNPIEVSLNREQIKPITLDIDALFDFDPNRSYPLHGRLVYATGEPVETATIRSRDRTRAPFSVDEDGRFVLSGLAPNRRSRFQVTIPGGEEGRPLSRERHVFSVNPEDIGNPAQTIEWVVPVYRWLVLGLAEEARKSMNLPLPYPVYVLQREDSGVWQDIGADEFIAQPDGMAISVTQMGTYRCVVALSAVHCLYSNPVTFAAEDQEVYVPMTLAQASSAANYRLSYFEEDEAQTDVLIRVIGDHESLPPLQVRTDRMGQALLGPTNAGTVYLTVGTVEYDFRLTEISDNHIVIAK